MDSESNSIGGSITSPINKATSDREVNSQTATEYIPKIGDRFKTIEEAHKLYTLYGVQRGFSVRKGGEKRDKDGNVVYKSFHCNKEGVTKEKMLPVNDGSSTSTRNTAIRRFSCLARLSVSRQKDGFYIVSVFNDEHSHVLTSPRSSHCLKSNRHVTDGMRYLMDAFNRGGIPHNMQIRLLAGQSVNGIESLGCLPKDIENARAHEKHLLLRHDANTLLVYFENRKRNNLNFEYKVLRDENNTLKNCFWSDAHVRMSYSYFGDCCVMDSTYKTNKYHMIFAIIAGVNHHRQTIMFGSTLLSGESVENHIWVFQTWFNSMPGSVPPKIIIIDQDVAIRIAVSQVLPNTFHRLCIWHIIMKFDQKLSKQQFKDYYGRFKAIIYNCKKREEFNNAWNDLILEADGLRHTSWFKEIYEVRERWVPAYCKHIFSAGMSSSQRVESSHAFFKQYVNEKISLIDFMILYDSALEKQRSQEIKADHADVDQGRRCQTYTSIERELANTYTKENFVIFQEELLRSQEYLRCIEGENNDDEKVYKVIKEETSHWEDIFYNTRNNFVICACNKFYNEGIPCRHVLFLYRKLEQVGIPKEYILNSWTKEAKANRLLAEEIEVNTSVERDVIARNFLLSKLAQEFVNKASMTIESLDLAKSILLSGIKEIDKVNKESGVNLKRMDTSSAIPEEGAIIDPNKVKTKGSGVPKRYKSMREKVQEDKLKRICGRCHVRGHNSRKCPLSP